MVATSSMGFSMQTRYSKRFRGTDIHGIPRIHSSDGEPGESDRCHVIATDDPTAVLNDAGGTQIGAQKFGAKGVVIGGPVYIGG